jgi:hypothetical protein
VVVWKIDSTTQPILPPQVLNFSHLYFMLKISQAGTANGTVTLKLEGSIAGPWVAEVCMACERFLSEHKVLRLDMADVSFVDRNGSAAISGLKSRGVALENCPPFVEEQLKGS